MQGSVALAQGERAVLLSVLLVCGAPLAAQEVSVGLKAGVSAARLIRKHVEESYSSPYREALAAGADVTLRLGSVVGLRVEALLAEKGSGGLPNMRIRYLEFPVTLRFAAPRPIAGFRPALHAGAAYARERSCRLVTIPIGMLTDPSPIPPREVDCWESRQTGLDMSFVAGLELERALGLGRATLEVRYTRGERDLASRWACCRTETRTVTMLVGYGVTLIR